MGVGEELRAMITRIEEHNAVSLSPVERLLLASDGTLTHSLEALTRAPIHVDILDRSVCNRILTRYVALRAGDATPFVWARSRVNLTMLPDEMAAELVEGDTGIGHLLRNEYTETHRKVVSMDAVWSDSDDFPDFIGETGIDTPLYLKRIYEIYADGEIIMTITEWLPKGLF